MQSCEEMNQEIAETGENRYCIEEEIEEEMDSEDNSQSSSSSSSSSDVEDSESMEEEDEENGEEDEPVPVIEMVFLLISFSSLEIRYGALGDGRYDQVR